MFLESGAWKNIEELEDILILEELLVLYERTVERQERLMKTIGAAMGAEYDDDHRERKTFDSDSGGYVKNVIENAQDIAMLPIPLGYENIS